MNRSEVQAIKWQNFDPRLGNYDDCDAAVVLCLAADFLYQHHGDPQQWAMVDTERTAFRWDDGIVWVVTMDYDGAPDGRDAVETVEVHRA